MRKLRIGLFNFLEYLLVESVHNNNLLLETVELNANDSQIDIRMLGLQATSLRAILLHLHLLLELVLIRK